MIIERMRTYESNTLQKVSFALVALAVMLSVGTRALSWTNEFSIDEFE